MAVAVSIPDAPGGTRECRICRVQKPLLEYPRDNKAPEGRSKRCKACAAANTRRWQAANGEKARATKRQKYAQTRDVQREKDRARYQKRSVRQRENAKRWYAENREKVLARMASPEGREYSRNKMREKLKDDGFRLHSNVSRAIRASVKDKGRRGWEEVVGYDLPTLMAHLERQFLPGMTWANHGMGKGRWHIDHITPKSLFHFSSASDPDFTACWALPNLRPMWSEQNISKHAKRLYLL